MTSPSSPPEDANATAGAVGELAQALIDRAREIDVAADSVPASYPASHAHASLLRRAASSLNRVSIADEIEKIETILRNEFPDARPLAAYIRIAREIAALSSTPTPIDGEDK